LSIRSNDVPAKLLIIGIFEYSTASMIFPTINQLKPLLATCLLLLISAFNLLHSQRVVSSFGAQGKLQSVIEQSSDLFAKQGRFIKNIGQYNDTSGGYESMGPVLYGYEGLPLPVLFTSKGVVHIQRKQRILSYEERAELINRSVTKEERKKLTAPTYQYVSFEWVDANPNVEIIATNQSQGYHTYGMLQQKAFAYKKITYKNIYPGVDAEYSFTGAEKPGYEYSLHVSAGADISKIKIRIGGDVQSITVDGQGRMSIKSSFDEIVQSIPLYYLASENSKPQKQKAAFSLTGNEYKFSLPAGVTNDMAFVIDPFVSNTNSLTGSAAGKAKDIDFDYNGNVYVAGGGDDIQQQLAKYSPAGELQWTFSGTLTTPAWRFGSSHGGWIVEKGSGAIYMGQGLNSLGFSVARFNTNGFYDNYITTPNTNFTENWKMIYSCTGGIPGILIAGGGGSANNELAVLDPSNTTPVTSNLSGLPGGHNDISDIVIDPVTNEMYTIYSTPVTDISRDNLIYKHAPPYNSGTMIWQSNSGGLRVLREPVNRPYNVGLDNSSNMLAVNSRYLYYWDGKNLKAYSKATGIQVGNLFTIAANQALWQGGIFADECDNIFIGNANGNIKVLKFDGTNFDDAALNDITLSGFAGTVYDLAYDNAHQLLYACGFGFVASIDLASYCPSAIYTINRNENCAAGTVQFSLSPAPPTGTTTDYELYQGTTLLGTSNTGLFTGLVIGQTYTIKVFLNKQCGGTLAQNTFIFYDSPLLVINDPIPVCFVGTTDLTLPAVTAGTTPGFSLSYWNNVNATSAIANPTTVPAGTYYIKATPAVGCHIIKKADVVALPPPIPNAGRDTIICYGANLQLNAANATTYSWTPTIWLDNPSSQNPTLINPTPGIYTYSLSVTDAIGCTSAAPDFVSVKVNPPLPIGLPRDTVVAINQVLQLNAIDILNSGFINYVWTPSFGLSDPNISNPIAILDHDMNYQVTALTPDDCIGMADIKIKVYKGPEIYVPSAFTPDNDGLNDVIRALPVGMKEFRYFKIFNRWGQLVFSTSIASRGWDGKISGMPQGTNTYVWIAEAVDINNNVVKRKGTITLIR